jgi:hypothetical protein
VEAFDHFAQGGFSWDDGRLTGLATLESLGHFAQQKFTLSALFIRTVAGEAHFREDGTHVATEG